MKQPILKLKTYFETRLLERELRVWQQLITYTAIKYLYMFLTVSILDGLWYSGSGSYHIDFVFWKELIASAVFVGVTFAYVKWLKKDGFAHNLLHLLYLIYYIPLNSSFAINNTTGQYFVLSNFYFILIIVLVSFFSKRLHKKEIKESKRHSLEGNGKSITLIDALCITMCALLIAHKINYNGFTFSFSMGESVYENRTAYQTYLQPLEGTLLNYGLTVLKSLLSYIVPFYLLISLINRKWWGVGISLLTVISDFSLSASKSGVLFIGIVLIIYFLYTMDWLRYFNRLIDIGILALLIWCVVEHFMTSTNPVYLLLVRREMYIPSWLNWLYYDFFSQTDKIHWSQSAIVLQNLIEKENEISPLVQISEAYFNGLISSPNTGMFAEAYMQLGICGVLLYPVFLAAVFAVSEKILNSYTPIIGVFIVCKFAISLINVPVLRTDMVLSYFAFMFILLFIKLIPQITKYAKNYKIFGRIKI